jgi:hypothetical protein
VQAAVALGRLQGLLQNPQFWVEVWTLVSQSGFESQSAIGGWQLVTSHWPALQACPVEQAVPQAPQLLGSVSRLASQPFAAVVSQSAYDPVQLPIAQLPVLQSPVALGGAQAAPQAPQSVADVREASQPVASTPSQSS